MDKYLKIRNKIRGPVYSIVTPFLEDDGIDYASLEKYIKQIHDAGGYIYFVMAYNSRFSQLSWSEIKELNSFVVNTAKKLNSECIVIVADPIHCSTKVTCEFANHAKEVGADLISLIFREKHYSDEQVYKHFSTVANTVDIGILVHEMPFMSGYGEKMIGYSLSLLDRLSDIPNIVAIKEDAKDDEYSKKVIDCIKDRVSIIISGGGKQQWIKFANDGCQSWLNGIGVFEPKLASKFWKSYQAGDNITCKRIMEEIEKPFFEQAVNKYGWHLTIKAAMEARGIINRHERLPMMALSNEDADKVAQIVNNLPIDDVLESGKV